jgi:hypothetical protein
MTAATLKAFVTMKSDEVIGKAKSGGVDPDPVIPPLLQILAPDQVELLLNICLFDSMFNLFFNSLGKSIEKVFVLLQLCIFNSLNSHLFLKS